MPTQDPASERKLISDEASGWIVRLNSGEATPADRRALAAWRAADARHDHAFREAEKAWAATSELSQDATSGLVKPGAKRKPGMSPKKLSILFVLGVTAAMLSWSYRGTPHDFETGTAEVRTILLPDGSRATLNARAALDLHFSETCRSITVDRGEVFFEVAADKSRPFVVEAAAARVTALGTAFNVRHVARSDDAEIVVTQHAVQVSTLARPDTGVRVSENQKVVVRAGVIGTVAPVDAQSLLSWRNGLLVAENKSLAEVLDELRLYHPGWIIVSNAALGDLRVSAVLNLRTPAASLDTLAAALPITVRHLSPALSIVTAR